MCKFFTFAHASLVRAFGRLVKGGRGCPQDLLKKNASVRFLVLDKVRQIEHLKFIAADLLVLPICKRDAPAGFLLCRPGPTESTFEALTPVELLRKRAAGRSLGGL